MYCSKCGKQIPDDSSFCPECGFNCNGGGKNINATTTSVDINKHKNYLLTTLKSPVTVMQNGLADLSLKVALMYGVVITLIIPLIKTLSIRIFSFNLVKSIASIFGEDYDLSDFGYSWVVKKEFNKVIGEIFPTVDIYFANLLCYVLFYGIIALIIYFIYKSLLKENISQENLVNIFFAFSIINLVITIISALVLSLGFIPWAIINVAGSIISIVLIYVGFNSIVEEKNKLVYLFSFAYVIALGAIIWFLSNNIMSMIYKIFEEIDLIF